MRSGQDDALLRRTLANFIPANSTRLDGNSTPIHNNAPFNPHICDDTLTAIDEVPTTFGRWPGIEELRVDSPIWFKWLRR